MRREDPVEAAVLERKLERVALDEGRLRRLATGLVDHRRALVEADDLAGKVAGEEARPARDVEGARGRQGGERPRQRLDLFLPARPVALGEAAGAEPPVVVLAGAAVVVGLHPS